jgi:vancomycin resistance protein YoaR
MSPAPRTKTKPPAKGDTPPVKSAGRRRARRVFLGVSAVLLSLSAAATAYAFAYSDRVLPRTYVNGVKVSGLSATELDERLLSIQEEFQNRTFTLDYEQKTWQVTGRDLGVSADLVPAAREAYQRGRQGSTGSQVWEYLTAPLRRRQYALLLLPFTPDGREYLQREVLKDIEKAYVETDIIFEPGNVRIKEGKPGERLHYNALEQDLEQRLQKGGDRIALRLQTVEPQVTPEMAEPVRQQGERLLAQPLSVRIEEKSVEYSPGELAGWLRAEVEYGPQEQVTGFRLGIREDPLKKAVAALATTHNRKPVNATVKMEGGRAVIEKEGSAGLEVNQDQTHSAIRQALLTLDAQPVKAVVETVPPPVRGDTLASLGIQELIGTATTDYTGSPNNRKFNIAVGQRSLNGGIVLHGEVYSTTATLGPVDEAHGYLPELVIINNRTIPESGGGLCQVSTTLFRAVLNAGLPVIERTNHSYRVGYYERGVGPGLDATVYIPNPDFKWKNDTGHAILIQSYIKDNRITFDLYGTKDGRVAEVTTPQILEEIPVGPPIYVDSDTLFKGETKQIETAHPGAKTVVYYTVKRDGKDIHKQTFRSNYRAWPAQYLVGTKERPPDAASSPAPAPDAAPPPAA